MKTYLVTGGAGFIGSNFILYILNHYDNVRIVNVDKLNYAGNLENLSAIENDQRYRFIRADICDKSSVARIFQQYDIDFLVNFAAETHVDRSISSPIDFATTNVLGTLNLLEQAKHAWQIGNDSYRSDVRFLQVSTDEVYGSLGSEGYFTEHTPLDPHSPYSASKAGADLLVQAYRDTYELPINITRCSNNYGPYQFPEKMIPLMLNNALQHRELPVYGDGQQVRDWLYVEDHCRAINLILMNGVCGEVYNIGGHNELTNLSLVKLILAYVQEHVDSSVDERLIRHVTDRKGHDRRYGIDATKIQQNLGWIPSTSFSDGIENTLAWYLKNREWLAKVTSGAYQEYYASYYGN